MDTVSRKFNSHYCISWEYEVLRGFFEVAYRYQNTREQIVGFRCAI